jgi:ribosomal-protein-alanine N-acetyltransferase
MNKTFESDRLFYRELLPSDDLGMFELDSNPEVQRYTGSKVVTSIDESRMPSLRRFASNTSTMTLVAGPLFSKETNEFLGWAGFKFHTSMNGYENVHDLGYRLLQGTGAKAMVMNRRKPLSTSGFRKCAST